MKQILEGVCIGILTGGILIWVGYEAGTSEVEAMRAGYEEQIRQAEIREQLIKEAVDKTISNYEKEAEDAKKEIDRLRIDVRNGNRRLSVAVRSCTVPTTSGNDIDQARAELDPAAADRIIAITEDGDTAIRKLNACIDQYNAVRKGINKPKGIE